MRPRPMHLCALFLLLTLMPLTAMAQAGPDGPPVPDVPAVVEQPAAAVASMPVPAAEPLPVAVVPVVAAPVPAEAAPDVVPPIVPAPEPSIWQNLGVQLFGYMLPGIAGVLVALLSWLLLLGARRLGLNIDLARDSMIRGAVRAAIAGAEEWAARKLKAGSKTGGAEKLQWAIDQLRERYPGALPDELRRMVDEELGLMIGVGATGDQAIGLLPGMELIDSPPGG